jgi:hypothetical protein
MSRERRQDVIAATNNGIVSFCSLVLQFSGLQSRAFRDTDLSVCRTDVLSTHFGRFRACDNDVDCP